MDMIILFHHQQSPIPKWYVTSQAAVNFISSLSRVACLRVHINADVTTIPIVSAPIHRKYLMSTALSPTAGPA